MGSSMARNFGLQHKTTLERQNPKNDRILIVLDNLVRISRWAGLALLMAASLLLWKWSDLPSLTFPFGLFPLG